MPSGVRNSFLQKAGESPLPRIIFTKMKHATLCYLINGNEILLGLKKRGFGQGKWNGFGGKVKEGETPEQATIREIKEEMDVGLLPSNLQKVAEIDFFFSKVPEWNQKVHVFFSKSWDGSPKESEEMLPKWFAIKDMPIYKMWNDDPHWLPHTISGKKIKAEFTFGEDNESITGKKVSFVNNFN